jgi:cbb3-type cytochrome oxidase subunit 3
MDINLIRSLVTLAAMVAFFAIVWWAYAPSRKAGWERRGRLEHGDKGEA